MSRIVSEIILIPEGMGLDAAKAQARYVARGLSSIGMKVREHISVCPDSAQFRQAVATALSRSNILVTIGGMGSSSGYLAKTVLSRGLSLPLEENAGAFKAISDYCRKTGEELSPADRALAMLPKTSEFFPCFYGKIPGCAISSSKQHIIMLPDTAAEIAPMFNRYVSPYLGGTATTTVTRTIRTYGVKEKDVSDALGEMMNAANPAVTLQRDDNEVLVRVSANAATPPQAAALCTPILQDIVDTLGDCAYGLDVDSLQSAVVQKLEKKELDISVAEGGTGGIFTRVLSETPGGQDVLRYTVSVDTPEQKEKKLGIKSKILKKCGNVSEYAAIAAADAARQRGETALGISILANTGQDNFKDCPKGAVYIAVCDKDDVYVKKLLVGGNSTSPDIILDATLSRALNMTRLVADYYPDRYTAAIPLEDALNGLGVTELDKYEDLRLNSNTKFKANTETGKRGFNVRKFIFTLALLVFLGAAGYIGYYYYTGYTAAKQAEDLQNMFAFGDMETEVSPDFPKDYSYKFAGLWNANPDVVAFIAIDGTKVMYPIVKAEDNDYYLHRDFYGKTNKYGVPFMDYRVNLKKPSDNIVVYGHNMQDGQIFGELTEYKKLEFYTEHPVIDLATVYHENKYKIFSVFITNAYENQGPVFNYHDFIDAKNNEDFMNYVSELKKRSLIETTVDVTKNDELLTLSTCAYEFKDARLVIVARAVRKNEDAAVDTAGARLNPEPLMPDIWYETFGGEKPAGGEIYRIVPQSVNPQELAAEYLGARMDVEEELALLAEEQKAAEEAARIAEEQKEAEAKRIADRTDRMQKAGEAELARIEAQKQNQDDTGADNAQEDEASRTEEEKAEESEAARIAEEKRKAEESEATRIAEEKRKAEESEAARIAEEKRKAEEAEAARIAEEKKKAEETEAARIAEEKKKANEEKAAQIAEEKRLAEMAEAARREEEKLAEENESAESEAASEKTVPVSSGKASSVSVAAGGSVYRDADALDIISRVVQNEINSVFSVEAIKAQAVASYTFIKNANASGTTPYVAMASRADRKVIDAVSEVLGIGIYYNGKYAFTPYYATSGGMTNSSKDVWGGSYPYLIPVDSSVDAKAPYYAVKISMSKDKVAGLLSSKLGITATGDPSEWFEVLTYTEGGYNGQMSVCGETKSKNTGNTLTGRLMRESVLNLRSAKFDIEYDEGSGNFSFTTYGYGHGVGMSQNGANLLAKEGLSFVEILEHYYPGTTIE